jgi:flagellar biosynthesis anti-sigma factor FlgM
VRIDSYGATTAAEATEPTSKVGADISSTGKITSSTKPATEDTTTLSSNTGTVQSLTETALQPSAARAEKVQALKQQVASGQYGLDAGKIADALSSSDL